MKFMAVADWLDLTHRPPCLDVRPESRFALGHLPAAGNIPADELGERIHELPDKGTEVFVVGGAGARQAAADLDRRGRWQVAYSDEGQERWPAAVLERGAPARLWRPNAWIQEHHGLFPAGGQILDLAMGSGRNAVFLAMAGFRVEGVDILPEAVAHATSLAARHGVEIEARVGDLREAKLPAPASYDGLLVVNYLDRELLPRLSAALRPGGVLLYETFTLEQGRRVGRPRKRQWLLEPMELYESFSHLEILAYREGSPHAERYVASLAARRPVE